MSKVLDEVLIDEVRDASAWSELAAKLAKKAPRGGTARIAAVLAAVRAVGCGADRGPADELLASAAQVSESARKALTQKATTTIQFLKQRNSEPDAIISRAIEALFEGADASYMLRAVAQTLDQVYASKAALDIIRGAMTLAPPDRGWYEDTHALILISLARWDDATAAIDRLSKIDAGRAATLAAYIAPLRQPLDYWYASQFEQMDDNGDTTKRKLAEVQAAVRAIAGRVAALRGALVELVGDVSWLPDLSRLDPKRASDNGYDITGHRGSVPNLLWELRREWNRLGLVLLAAGCRDLAVPRKRAKCPASFDAYIGILAIRFNLLEPRLDGKPFAPEDDFEQQLGEQRWGGDAGGKLRDLDPDCARIYRGELSTGLAALRWMSGEIDSVFDDQ